MNRATVNFSTGPVFISSEVKQAFISTPISHRSSAFHTLYHDTTDFLCDQFNTQHAFLLTGSGTVANEAMIWQIKLLGGKGLILSNGEFGSRLINQASRASLLFAEYNTGSGGIFDLNEIEEIIREQKSSWVLYCHCETSTGVINDLNGLSAICARHNCLSFLDCMSTVGTYPLDLAGVTMASASSGKGLASLSGLAIVLSNISPVISDQLPLVLDLGYYAAKNGIPYTISSNQVLALNISTRQKLHSDQFKLVDEYAGICYHLLSSILPYKNEGSKVLTIRPAYEVRAFVNQLISADILPGFESDYLKSANLCQLAFFGYYCEQELMQLTTALRKIISSA